MDAQKKNMISTLCFGFLLYLSRGKYVHSFDKYSMGLGNTTGPQCLGGYTIKKKVNTAWAMALDWQLMGNTAWAPVWGCMATFTKNSSCSNQVLFLLYTLYQKNLCIKTETVLAGSDATVIVWFVSMSAKV